LRPSSRGPFVPARPSSSRSPCPSGSPDLRPRLQPCRCECGEFTHRRGGLAAALAPRLPNEPSPTFEHFKHPHASQIGSARAAPHAIIVGKAFSLPMASKSGPEMGVNSWLEDELYQQYLRDRSTVDESWKHLFEASNGYVANGAHAVAAAAAKSAPALGSIPYSKTCATAPACSAKTPPSPPSPF